MAKLKNDDPVTKTIRGVGVFKGYEERDDVPEKVVESYKKLDGWSVPAPQKKKFSSSLTTQEDDKKEED